MNKDISIISSIIKACIKLNKTQDRHITNLQLRFKDELLEDN